MWKGFAPCTYYYVGIVKWNKVVDGLDSERVIGIGKQIINKFERIKYLMCEPMLYVHASLYP